MFSKIQENIQNIPEARKQKQLVSWFMIGGGFLLLVIGLVTGEHPNPYLIPSLIVLGIDGLLQGLSLRLHLRYSRVVSWLAVLIWILFLLFLYLVVNAFLFG